TAHQGMESSLVLLGVERLEQVLVRHFTGTQVLSRSAYQLQDRTGGGPAHDAGPFDKPIPPAKREGDHGKLKFAYLIVPSDKAVCRLYSAGRHPPIVTFS